MTLVEQSILLMTAGAVAFVLFVYLLFAGQPRYSVAAPGHTPRRAARPALVLIGLLLFLSSIVMTTAGLFMIQLG